MLAVLAWGVAACSPAKPVQLISPDQGPRVLARMTSIQLQPPEYCARTFVTHNLDFTTGMRLREISTYISNGAGVAANDLDNDGDLDLVFASVDGQSKILWNEGGLLFTAQVLDDTFTRGVAIVDVDADGWNDITFTHRGLNSVSFWRNLGNIVPRFERAPLPGIDTYAYAMAWGDVNGDGALDLVTGSYGAELKQHGIDPPEQDPKAGVVLHLQRGGKWASQVLDRSAEALSLALVDLTQDGQPEIWAANDFALGDRIWQLYGEQWQVLQPFDQTSHSTMTTEWGDIANDNGLALFTTDMNPYDISTHTLANWVPVIDHMGEYRAAKDPQIMANVLQVRDSRGRWDNQATWRGVDATGWSWSARFGDLDEDGYLDLYVVNGMIATDLFGHLANGELVEENQAFRNRGDGSFAVAHEWQLGSTASGRGMLMADMDDDGDLDIVVNNLRSYAQLFENQLCSGASLQVDLQWPAAQNRGSIGAQLALQTDMGVLRRDVRAAGGYLSGNPLRVHFGFPAASELQALNIVWPDGAVSTVASPPAGARLTVIRSEQ